jgi:glycosyltransferase involved in cell wall biosynthesis
VSVRKPKIGMFAGYYPPHVGGVERYADKLSSSLEKLGYEIVIVTTNTENQPNYEKQGGRPIYRLPVHNIAKSIYPIPKLNKEYKELIRRIENERIDYYFLNTRFHLTSLVGARIGRRFKKPVILVEHGTGHFTVNNKVFDLFGCIYEHALTYVLKRKIDKFYGVSKNCNIWLRHFSIQATGVFYNAISVDDKKIASNDYINKYKGNEVVIAYAGRLIKEKGILNLLEAFERVKSKHKDLKLRLAIAGDGELLDVVKKDYRNSSVDLLGRLKFQQVMSLYKRADIFVYPSLYPEGLPTSILEAGLMNCAVIATPRGGTEEVIIDKHHGIIVDGSKESLSAAIEQLVLDPGKSSKLAKTLKQRVEKVFNWEVVAKEVDLQIKSFDKQ